MCESPGTRLLFRRARAAHLTGVYTIPGGTSGMSPRCPTALARSHAPQCLLVGSAAARSARSSTCVMAAFSCTW